MRAHAAVLAFVLTPPAFAQVAEPDTTLGSRERAQLLDTRVNRELRDSTGRSPLQSAEPLLSLQATAAGKEAIVRLGFGSGDKLLELRLKGPIDDSGDPARLASFDGLAGATVAELALSRLFWDPKLRVESADGETSAFDVACDAYYRDLAVSGTDAQRAALPGWFAADDVVDWHALRDELREHEELRAALLRASADPLATQAWLKSTTPIDEGRWAVMVRDLNNLLVHPEGLRTMAERTRKTGPEEPSRLRRLLDAEADLSVEGKRLRGRLALDQMLTTNALRRTRQVLPCTGTVMRGKYQRQLLDLADFGTPVMIGVRGQVGRKAYSFLDSTTFTPGKTDHNVYGIVGSIGVLTRGRAFLSLSARHEVAYQDGRKTDVCVPGATGILTCRQGNVGPPGRVSETSVQGEIRKRFGKLAIAPRLTVATSDDNRKTFELPLWFVFNADEKLQGGVTVTWDSIEKTTQYQVFVSASPFRLLRTN